SWGGFWGGRICLARTLTIGGNHEDRRCSDPRSSRFHGTSILALAGFPGKWMAGLPSYYFSLNFLPCRSACKSRLIPLRGVRNKGTKAVRVRRTCPGRTRKIYSRKCGRWTRTNQSATASEPVNNGQAAFGARSEFFGRERRFSSAVAPQRSAADR